MMNQSNKLLSDIGVYRTYSRYLPTLKRRETFEETINRCMSMHLDRFPFISRDIIKAFQKVHELKIMPSMRTLQFAGSAINKNSLRGYNCSFINITSPRDFSEILYLLLSGCGVGFSVQRHHINQLPVLGPPSQEGMFIVHDSIAGWSDALDRLINAYFYRAIRPVFDFSKISPKGTYLNTTGAKAPGPRPLELMLVDIENRLKLAIGRKLTSLEIHDILCIVSECVLSGGVRRSALISLFDRDDKDMLMCKYGEWWVKNPQRARANNSAVLPRKEVSREEFEYIYNLCRDSGSGEPGFIWTNDKELGRNPCGEISLNSHQLCNLSTVNQTGVKSKKDFLSRVYSAALIGTLQAAYTDFPYVSEKWKTVTEREALLGVSCTGIADSHKIIKPSWLIEGAKLVKQVNEQYAKKLGINIAARCTSIKPEGTASVVMGSSSGIHARHSDYYLRRIRLNCDDALTHYLLKQVPELIEYDKFASNTMVLTVGQESPNNSIIRQNETALSLFERTLLYNRNWISFGHRSGNDKHNVSVTISVRENEWEELKNVMWKYRHMYSGISLLPYDTGTYEQAPFEECSKEVYEKYNTLAKNIDLSDIKEETDQTNLIEQVACVGGICEIT